jgi:hypothetical protein
VVLSSFESRDAITIDCDCEFNVPVHETLMFLYAHTRLGKFLAIESVSILYQISLCNRLLWMEAGTSYDSRAYLVPIPLV